MSIRANPKMRFPQDGAFGLVEAECTSSLSGFTTGKPSASVAHTALI